MRTPKQEAAYQYAIRIGRFIRPMSSEDARDYAVKHLDCADFPAIADWLESCSPRQFRDWITMVLAEANVGACTCG